MRPVVINGILWRVLSVPLGDVRLVDRTGAPRLATTDPATMTVCVADVVAPPLLDRVMVHEMAHAVAVSHGILPQLHGYVADGSAVDVEEWAARMVELHGIEAVDAASRALGRPVCVMGYCHD